MKIKTNRKFWIQAAALILAALAMAVALEWVMQQTLPPIFEDMEVDISSDPTLIERGTWYTHPSGRRALVEEWHPLRLAATFMIQLGILLLIFPAGLGRKLIAWIKKTAVGLKNLWKTEKTRILGSVLCFAAAFLVVFFGGRAWIQDAFNRDNWMTAAVCFWAGIGAGSLAAFRRTLAKKPEVLFLVIILIVGGLLSYFLPDSTGVSLDDGYHFQHALNYSTLGRVRFTGTDWDVMQDDNEKNYELNRWDEFLQAQDEKYARGAIFVTAPFHLDIKEYWMSTYGVGLFLGRVLHLRYWDMWSLGRFTGLLAYALIGFFAIRRLKSGRMVLALILLMPSNVFLAANYSYDPGVTAGIALACAYWIAQWQERDQKLKNRDAAVMIIGMLTACYAKAIYFPIFLLFLFLPGSKFRNEKHRRAYTAVMLLAMAAVMLYILLPLGKSGGQGDERAEGDVDTFRQIQFILQNPLVYADYLWHFFLVYLNPNEMDFLTNSFGYQGCGRCMITILMLLAVTTFTDAGEENLLPPAGVRVFGEVLLFGTLALTATSMYVWFSAVGAPTFDGMQPRYMIPFMYPAMALLNSNRIRNRMNPALYHGILLAGMAFAVISGTVTQCVEYYH